MAARLVLFSGVSGWDSQAAAVGRRWQDGAPFPVVLSHHAGACLGVRSSAVWAGVAQLVEHLICNQAVGGSNPFASSISRRYEKVWLYCQSSCLQSSSIQSSAGSCMDQKVCLGTAASGSQSRAQVAEWLMAADCKSAPQRGTEVRILPCAPRFTDPWQEAQ